MYTLCINYVDPFGLNIIDHILLFYLVTGQDHARKQASPRWIFGEQSGTGTGLPSST